MTTPQPTKPKKHTHWFFKHPVAVFIHNHRKDILALPVIVISLVILLVAITHTLTVLFGVGAQNAIQLIFPALLIALALGVIVKRNPMHSLLCLIGMFVATVILFLYNGAEFLGLVFLIVYVGAVAILFLFVIMLLPLNSLASKATGGSYHKSQILAIIAGTLLLNQLYGQLSEGFNTTLTFTTPPSSPALTTDALVYAVRMKSHDIQQFTPLYSENSLLFFLVTMILLLAMLGAIVLATTTIEPSNKETPQPAPATSERPAPAPAKQPMSIERKGRGELMRAKKSAQVMWKYQEMLVCRKEARKMQRWLNTQPEVTGEELHRRRHVYALEYYKRNRALGIFHIRWLEFKMRKHHQEKNEEWIQFVREQKALVVNPPYLRARPLPVETKAPASTNLLLFVAAICSLEESTTPTLFTNFIVIIFLPFLSFLIFMTASRFVKRDDLARPIVALMGTAVLSLLYNFPIISQGNVYTATIGNWSSSELFDISWTFNVDALTYTMLIVVLTVSTLVHLYSTEYMSEDPHLPRFMSYLSLFTFFMLLLISSDNFVGLFLGWEGVGLCSYLLISFWFTRVQANKAAIKAMVVNRIADLAFTVGILAIFYTFQSVEFAPVFAAAPYLTESTILFGAISISPLTLITFLLFLGAMGKSAQIGLHTWLPDAMEGPTPVSALIHAATMVTAGVFLIIRCSPLFESAPSVLLFITFVGAATAFMAATAGLLQNDLKKVIAYSTCSQLGYMVFACGLSSYGLSLFHLSNHAFFKALLFLSAGAVIHSISSEQDLRRLGGLGRILPYTHVMFVIGSLALMGFPFLTGFYSKDLILEVAASTITIPGTFAYWLGLVTAFFTAYYSYRLLYLAFYGPSRSGKSYLSHAHELTPRMAFSLAVLSIGSIFLGYCARDLFVGFGTPFWNGVIYHSPAFTGAQLAGEFLPLEIKMTPFFGSCASVALVFLLNGPLLALTSQSFQNRYVRSLTRFLSHKWYFDTVYNRLINKPLLEGAYNITFSLIDKGVLESVGPTGFGRLSWEAGRTLASFLTGRVYDYAGFMIVTTYILSVLFEGIAL